MVFYMDTFTLQLLFILSICANYLFAYTSLQHMQLPILQGLLWLWCEWYLIVQLAILSSFTNLTLSIHRRLASSFVVAISYLYTLSGIHIEHILWYLRYKTCQRLALVFSPGIGSSLATTRIASSAILGLLSSNVFFEIQHTLLSHLNIFPVLSLVWLIKNWFIYYCLVRTTNQLSHDVTINQWRLSSMTSLSTIERQVCQLQVYVLSVISAVQDVILIAICSINGVRLEY